jgi:hypothetical protein
MLPPEAAAVAAPSIMGPITGPGAPALDSTSFSLAPFGYREEEFFITGTATGYVSDGLLSSDGKWSASPGETADYTTRILVRRPTSRARFNGTVVVEWLNVSGGFDAAPIDDDPYDAHARRVRVGRGLDAVRRNQRRSPLDRNLHLQAVNPARYGTLRHPGDTFSYDVFSQAGEAIRQSADLLLGGLGPKHVLAVGESQSAYRLVTYINAVHPQAKVYDGFLVHSRSGDTAPLSKRRNRRSAGRASR